MGCDAFAARTLERPAVLSETQRGRSLFYCCVELWRSASAAVDGCLLGGSEVRQFNRAGPVPLAVH